MAYKYKHFIPQNTAPSGAKCIGVYDNNGNKVCSIPLGKLTPPSKEKLYSFGLVSDIHLYDTSENNSKDNPSVDVGVWKPNTKFDNALTYFENQGCLFCCICGDLTQTGFYRRTNESDASTTYLDEYQLLKYQTICGNHSIPIYEIAGNHESYYSKNITENLIKWNTYTGERALYYTVSQGNDLFIFLGQPSGTTPMSTEALSFLSTTLSANSNKRCFVFVHPHISSGNALGKYEINNFFNTWGSTTDFVNLLKGHKNTILFHGHSHFQLECQEVDETANYTEKDGFKSMHIPSLSRPCAIVNGVRTYQDAKSQGYVVDVYDDCIVLNGMDLINNECVPLGTYKIDTKLQAIAPNTFTDSTGTITI